MIAQINKGCGFAGLVDYANDIKKKDTQIICSEGVCLTNNASIVASLKVQAAMNPSVKDFVGHISLSVSPDDTSKLTDVVMAKLAQEYLLRMGIANTPYVVFRHKDQPHDHVHIVYCRIDNNGKETKCDTNFKKSIAITKALTREFGLTFGKGKSRVRRERLKGKDKIKYRLYDVITTVLKGCKDWNSLRSKLAAKGISARFVNDANGNPKGIVFTDDKHKVSFAGGKIDRSLSFGNICKQMVQLNDYSINTESEVIVDRTRTDKANNYNTSDNPRATHDVSLFNDTPTNSDGGYSQGNRIGAAIVEVVLQPHVAPVSGGGGDSNDLGWRDDDDKKNNNNNNYKPRRRR